MDTRQLLKQARAVRLAGSAAHAMRLLTPLVTTHPGSSAIRWELALTLLALEQHQRAAAEMDRVIDARPDFTVGLIARAGLRAGALGDLPGAQADLDRALAHEPDNAAALMLQADLGTRRNDRSQTLGALERLIEQSPDDPDLRVRRATWLIDASEAPTKQDLEQAVADLDVAIAADPRPAWLNRRGVHHAALGDWEAAAADFRTVLDRCRPGQPDHLVALEGSRRCERREPMVGSLAGVMSDWLKPADREPPAAGPPADDDASSPPVSALKQRWTALKTGVRDEVNRRLADQIGQEIAIMVRPPPPRYEVPSGKIRGVDWRFHRQIEKTLERLGFELLADFEPLHLSQATGVRTLERYFADDNAVITARVVNTGQRPDTTLTRLALKTVGQQSSEQVIELVTEFENGDFVVTDNGKDDPFDGCEPANTERLPRDTLTEALVDRHRRRVAEHANAGSSLPLRLDGLEDLHAQRRRLWQLRDRWRQGFGWFRDRELAAVLGERHAELGTLVRRSLVEQLQQQPGAD